LSGIQSGIERPAEVIEKLSWFIIATINLITFLQTPQLTSPLMSQSLSKVIINHDKL